jgi:signal transduction histidine kinase
MLNHPPIGMRGSALNSPIPVTRKPSRFARQKRPSAAFAFSRDTWSPDPVLRAVIGASHSNLAVLDELGEILCASDGFRELVRSLHLISGSLGAEAFFSRWKRESGGTPECPGVSLSEDLERFLRIGARPLRQQYSSRDQTGLRVMAVDAQAIDLADSPRRILLTLVEVPDRSMADDTSGHFAGRLIAAQEEERKRIARELHDDFSQQMALLSIELDRLAGEPAGPGDWSSSCQHLRTRIDELALDLHRLSHRLHPSRLDHLGLEAAVSGLCRELSEGRDLKIEFRHEGPPAILPNDVALCVFRIAQEALRNCIKHSRATLVQVTLRNTKLEVQLAVDDNGVGFDPEAASSMVGLGFVSMRERLDLVGGIVHVLSRPLRGTRIEVSIPLKQGSEI